MGSTLTGKNFLIRRKFFPVRDDLMKEEEKNESTCSRLSLPAILSIRHIHLMRLGVYLGKLYILILYSQVWSSSAGQTHNPPSDLVMKGQTWFTDDEMKTVLIKDEEVGY